jgi:hypothetical protein
MGKDGCKASRAYGNESSPSMITVVLSSSGTMFVPLRLPLYIPLLLCCSTQLPGQGTARCRVPGAVFGITALSPDTARQPATASSNVPPTVVRATPASAFHSGDVIERIDSLDVTTIEGSERFRRPPKGNHVLHIHRDGRPLDVHVRVRDGCGVIAERGLRPPIGKARPPAKTR